MFFTSKFSKWFSLSKYPFLNQKYIFGIWENKDKFVTNNLQLELIFDRVYKT